MGSKNPFLKINGFLGPQEPILTRTLIEAKGWFHLIKADMILDLNGFKKDLSHQISKSYQIWWKKKYFRFHDLENNNFDLKRS